MAEPAGRRLTLSGHLIWQRAHRGGSISPLMIFTTCDASTNSVATIAKVTLTKLSLGRVAGRTLSARFRADDATGGDGRDPEPSISGRLVEVLGSCAAMGPRVRVGLAPIVSPLLRWTARPRANSPALSRRSGGTKYAARHVRSVPLRRGGRLGLPQRVEGWPMDAASHEKCSTSS